MAWLRLKRVRLMDASLDADKSTLTYVVNQTIHAVSIAPFFPWHNANVAGKLIVQSSSTHRLANGQ